MIKLIIQSIRQTIIWSFIAGVVYTVVMTVFAQVVFHNQAEGSLVVKDGNVIGSVWLAQQFQGTNYFWPRPSSCSYGTGPTGISASSGSNLGPTSGALHTNVLNNIASFISGNNLPTNTVVPADMVYASASGLDPHISPEAARLQISRVAVSRGLSEDKVKELVDRFIEPPQWGFLGQARVNVLLLNAALDEAQAGVKKAGTQHAFRPKWLTMRGVNRSGASILSRHLKSHASVRKPNPIVLLIDDDKANRRLLRMLLESQHYRLYETGNGEHGLAAAGERHPDVIILELSLLLTWVAW